MADCAVARSDRFVHRRRGGVLGAAGAAVAEAGSRAARGRVRVQRRARRDSRADVQRGALRVRAAGRRSSTWCSSLVTGSAIGLVVGLPRCPRAATHCAACFRAVTRSRPSGWGWSRSPPPARPMPAGSSPLTWPLWCWRTRDWPHRSATRSFAEGVGWLAQIGLFVLLGLLVNPSDMVVDVVPAVIIGLLFTAARSSAVGVGIARRFPDSVAATRSFCRGQGLRGAGSPSCWRLFRSWRGVPDSYRLLNIVFVHGGGVHVGAGSQPAPDRLAGWA